MMRIAGWKLGALGTIILLASGVQAQDAARKTPEALKAEINALRTKKPAWREIAWKSCLVEGLRESREKKKPLILWMFLDRPIDDARC